MTQPAKHTPGPWEARIGKGDLKLGQYPSKAMHFTIESGTRKLMAMGEAWKCEDDPTMFSEVTANAHLIAAAPAMYEALKAMLGHEGERVYSGIGTEHDSEALEAAKQAARAALAQAGGNR